MKIITIEDVDGEWTVPKGSVFEAELVDEEGNWYGGTWSSMYGTYYVEVPVKSCREWTEAQDDPIAALFRRKYEQEKARDHFGELPRTLLVQQIRRLRDAVKKGESIGDDRQGWALDRDKDWLKSTEVYYNRVYGELDEEDLK